MARAASGRPGPARLGTEIELDDGTTVTVDEAYLTRAIADPGAETHAGFAVTMPENRLTDDEIAEVVDYIVALNGAALTHATDFTSPEGLRAPSVWCRKPSDDGRRTP